MKTQTIIPLFVTGIFAAALVGLAAVNPKRVTEQDPRGKQGPIRVLFLGHDSKHHNSNKYYPMLAKGLGVNTKLAYLNLTYNKINSDPTRRALNKACENNYHVKLEL